MRSTNVQAMAYVLLSLTYKTLTSIDSTDSSTPRGTPSCSVLTLARPSTSQVTNRSFRYASLIPGINFRFIFVISHLLISVG